MHAPQTLLENFELIARQAVEGFIIGLHKSPFHGFSVEFAEHRQYNPGDPLRHVDWRVYGRTGKLVVKRFEEETNLRCCIAVDTSASMQFPADRISKLQFSCLSAAALLHLLKRQLDASCLALFDESIHYFSDCRSASRHYSMLLQKLHATLEYNRTGRTQAAAALHQVAEQMHKRSLVIVFSDMLDDTEQAEELFASLQHLRYNNHEVILFHVVDGILELDFEFENRPYQFVDMETGEQVKLQPAQVREVYTARMQAFRKEVEARCQKYRIDYVPADLTQPVDQVLHAFLLKRNKLL